MGRSNVRGQLTFSLPLITKSSPWNTHGKSGPYLSLACLATIFPFSGQVGGGGSSDSKFSSVSSLEYSKTLSTEII